MELDCHGGTGLGPYGLCRGVGGEAAGIGAGRRTWCVPWMHCHGGAVCHWRRRCLHWDASKRGAGVAGYRNFCIAMMVLNLILLLPGAWVLLRMDWE